MIATFSSIRGDSLGLFKLLLFLFLNYYYYLYSFLLLGASLWIHNENQGLVLVAPAFGIDKLYFDGQTFSV